MTNEERKKLLENPKTWLEAKEERALLVTAPNLAPTNDMFRPEGELYPTRCFVEGRRKNEALLLPVRYDIDYVLDFYQQRVIKQLSLENQLALLKAVTALYTDNTSTEDKPSISEQFKELDSDSQLELLKQLAKSLGKRVIANK